MPNTTLPTPIFREVLPKNLPLRANNSLDMTTAQLAAELLKHNKGIAFGESHTDRTPKRELVAMMPQLKQSGVTTLFFEMTDIETPEHQKILDHYFKYGDNKDAVLKALGKFTDYTDGREGYPKQEYMNIIDAAKQHGIRIVGINRHTKKRFDVDALWAKDIAQYVKQNLRPQDKFIVYVGSAHTNTIKPVNPEQFISRRSYTAGVDGLLGIPAIDFAQKNARDNTTNLPLGIDTAAFRDFYDYLFVYEEGDPNTR
jgi:hypothetical protein